MFEIKNFIFQHDYLELVNRGFIELGQKVDLCIPTGNFGNILSSIYAKEMGIPYDQIICASNDNKVLHDFFTTGIYDLRDRYLHKTISPAIGRKYRNGPHWNGFFREINKLTHIN